MENASQYSDARECLLAARAGLRQVRQRISQPSAEAADDAAALLRDVEVQLGCVAAILRRNGAKPDAGMRTDVEEMQSEVAVLAAVLAGADRMFAGWLDAVRSRRGGYTECGQAAPLMLVRKLSVEG
jgi:hypothetical protein